MSREVSGGPSRALAVAALGGALVYSWVATATEPFSWHARIFTAVPGVAAVALTLRAGWHRPREQTSRARLNRVALVSLLMWGLLITVTVAFQLATFFSHPRDIYPTLSSLVNEAFSNHPIRAGGFAGWLALGWYVLRS